MKKKKQKDLIGTITTMMSRLQALKDLRVDKLLRLLITLEKELFSNSKLSSLIEISTYKWKNLTRN
jgi:hypothetical protein